MTGPSQPIRIDPASLPLDGAIKEVHGAGSRVVYVFESADCPFCRKLQPELETLPDATIYTFVLPGHSPGSKSSASAVWCAPDRLIAWRLALSGSEVPVRRCMNDPSGDNLTLAKALKLSGTPAIITGAGQVHVGLVSGTELEALLEN